MEELHQLGEQAAEIHYKPQSLQDVAFLVTQPVLPDKNLTQLPRSNYVIS